MIVDLRSNSLVGGNAPSFCMLCMGLLRVYIATKNTDI